MTSAWRVYAPLLAPAFDAFLHTPQPDAAFPLEVRRFRAWVDHVARKLYPPASLLFAEVLDGVPATFRLSPAHPPFTFAEPPEDFVAHWRRVLKEEDVIHGQSLSDEVKIAMYADYDESEECRLLGLLTTPVPDVDPVVALRFRRLWDLMLDDVAHAIDALVEVGFAKIITPVGPHLDKASYGRHRKKYGSLVEYLISYDAASTVPQLVELQGTVRPHIQGVGKGGALIALAAESGAVAAESAPPPKRPPTSTDAVAVVTTTVLEPAADAVYEVFLTSMARCAACLEAGGVLERAVPLTAAAATPSQRSGGERVQAQERKGHPSSASRRRKSGGMKGR